MIRGLRRILFCVAFSGMQLACWAQNSADGDPLAKARYLLDSGERAAAQAIVDDLLVASQGVEDERVATAVDIAVLARILRLGAASDKAELNRLAQRGFAIRERLYGDDAAELAPSLEMRARVAMNAGDKKAAVADAERALQLREMHFGAGDPRTVPALLNACGIYYAIANYTSSQQMAERAVAILAAQLPVDAAQLALAHRQLGVAASANGEQRLAIEHTSAALAGMARTFGDSSPAYVEVLLNLGVMHNDAGDYDAASDAFERALAHADALRENNASLYGGMFNNYGHLLATIGNLPRAHELLQQALDVAIDPVTTGMRLTNLADVQHAEGDLAAAEAGYRRALDSYAQQLGPDSPRLLFPSAHLGMLLLDKGDMVGAREVLAHGLAIGEKAYGPEHPLLGATLRTLGEVDLAEARYADARALIERALHIRTKQFGEDHPEVAELRALLAEAIRGMGGDDDQALALALDAEMRGQAHVRLTVRALPEREALTYAAVRPTGLSTALGIVAQHPERDPRQVWQAAIGARGLVLRALLQRHRAAADERAPRIVALRRKWIDASATYARLLVRASTNAGDVALLGKARAAMENAERELGRAKPSATTTQAPPTLDAIAAALPADAALVAFARASAHAGVGNRRTDQYIAFVLPGKKVPPAAVAIGSAATVDALVDAWRAAVSRAPAGNESDGGSIAAGEALRAAVWDPVAAHVHANTVFIVADGKLLFVNFTALPRDGRYLVENGPTLHLLNDERELLAAPVPRATGELLAIGGVDFGTPTNTRALADGSARADTPSCSGAASNAFSQLPGSLREAQDIAVQWQHAPHARATTLTGESASVGAFKRNAAHKAVLHLATHAFVYDDARCVRPGPALDTHARGVLLAGNSAGTTGSALQLAGLAFSGANRETLQAEDSDGIVTAEEIGTLDLHGTAWAVLSACYSGVGRLLAGEGVLGLRYAFRSAGVRTVIMSLWAADDEATREWMHELYVARLARHASTAEAVRIASVDTLRKRRAAGASTHPYYWAPFVAVGDWR
jgi:CHAT domain-containing protein/tetratricopeptide (TPR) repeat protein